MRSITVGYEYEIADGGDTVAEILHRMGATGDAHLHPYHCSCSAACKHDDPRYLFSPQQDPTVSAEFPSKILEWGSERCESAFETMERAVVIAGAGLGGDSGMHVHVAKPFGVRSAPRDDDGTPLFTRRGATTWRLLRLFTRYQSELAEIAAGPEGQVRGYNEPMEVPAEASDLFWNADLTGRCPTYQSQWERTGRPNRDGANLVCGSWLTPTRHDKTYEFRLWNAGKAAWRQRLAVGLSVAMTCAAADGVLVTEHDTRCIEDVIGPYMDDATWAGVVRQRFIKGGLK